LKSEKRVMVASPNGEVSIHRVRAMDRVVRWTRKATAQSKPYLAFAGARMQLVTKTHEALTDFADDLTAQGFGSISE
jgi:hypothetical protein